MAKRSSKFKINWKLFIFLGIMLVVFGAGLGLGSYYLQINSDSSSTGEEILEEKSNTIPPDVLAQIKKQQHVLGANSNKSILPYSIHVPILMYHYIEYVQDKNDKLRIALDTTPYTLEQEIKTLQDAGYTFMTNNELTQVLDGKATLPSKPVLLTFDDGYRDFWTDAYPILKKYNVKATQYVIAGFLNFANHLTTEQLQAIAKDGLVEIGAHTVHHVALRGKQAKTVAYEVGESKKILESLINKPVVSFAYPFGSFDEQAIQIVKNSGFSSATSTIPGADQLQAYRYFLPRLRPGGMNGQTLLNCLNNVNRCYGI